MLIRRSGSVLQDVRVASEEGRGIEDRNKAFCNANSISPVSFAIEELASRAFSQYLRENGPPSPPKKKMRHRQGEKCNGAVDREV